MTVDLFVVVMLCTALGAASVIAGVLVADRVSRRKHERDLRELEAYERSARLALEAERATEQPRSLFLSPE